MSLLCLQDNHVVKAIWEGSERVLRPRRHALWIAKHVDELDERVINILQAVGFHHILKTTVTLEDVALQLGLPIEGNAVTSISSGPLTLFCQQLLGHVPPENTIRGNRIKLSWLNNTFRQLPHDAPDEVVEQYARAYMLLIIGSILMPDTSASMVHLMYLPLLADLQMVVNYSWASAVLACLYRALDHGTRVDQDNIGDCMILLQCWAWERITCIAPQIHEVNQDDIYGGAVFPVAKRWCRTTQSIFHDTTTLQQFRQKLDDLTPKQFIWTPYRCDEIRRMITVQLPPTSRAVVPLICFSVVEFHHSDRVIRQLGFRQLLPQTPMNLDKIHKEDMRGRADWDWQEHHKQWIGLWNDHQNRFFNSVPFHKNGHLRDEYEYMQWYISHTIRYLAPIVDDSSDEEYDLDQQQHFQAPSAYRSSPPYDVP
ncbi:serine/threonine-protein phosphatase 7 long form homolog [Vigna radiata var. radiata]|uniref:Serine/threonine-protein phosphatase 7 long form homolog n=1 Tax=Vigna radiata var. radiata TaxID=3916 RepID=A0A1S3U0F3_VIGRR|nr:serine/threonine-protein phosphatase 7 long form homolog [Vigna radiata var. radiata]